MVQKWCKWATTGMILCICFIWVCEFFNFCRFLGLKRSNLCHLSESSFGGQKLAKSGNFQNSHYQMKDLHKSIPQTHFQFIWTQIGGGDRFFCTMFLKKSCIFRKIKKNRTNPIWVQMGWKWVCGMLLCRSFT